VLTLLSTHDPFPPTDQAWGDETDAPGLLCAGADLSPQRLLAAYKRGIFPWFSNGQPILWWSTHPRMVLAPANFKLRPSLAKRIKQWQKNGLEIRFDTATPQVIRACADAERQGQNGTWIVPEMQSAYAELARLGHVHSVEVWLQGHLVGGLYCVAIGKAVFGESMFHWQTDASKVALAALVAFCRCNGIGLIDCQQQTSHLAQFGAVPIDRAAFTRHLDNATQETSPIWRFDPLYWNSLFPTPTRTADGPPQ
jgi:leucyl/phenylalanyl-tRNA---protein transferase